MSYSWDKFLRPLSSTDTNIQVLDNNGVVSYTINPYAILNVLIKNNLVRVSLKSGKVIARKQDKFTLEELKAFLIQNTDFQKATLYTYDFTGYKPFKKIVSHAVINHSRREYAKNGIHTNTIEGFWGIFKRAIVGSYHKLSVKHLDAYIQECCFKYNNRNNANMFDMLLINSVR